MKRDWFRRFAAEGVVTGQSIPDQSALVVAPNAERIAIVEGGRSSNLIAAPLGMLEHRFSIRRKRLLFRSWSRGTQESDLILGSFADCTLGGFDESQLDRFEALLDCSDPDLFDWILGGIEPPMQHHHDVLRMLRTYWAPRSRAVAPQRTCSDPS
jgi:antitoxin CptB